MAIRPIFSLFLLVTTLAQASPARPPRQQPDIAAAKLGPDGNIEPRFASMHASFLKRGKEGPVGVLFLGDSITEGWNYMPDIWKERYARHAAANFAIAGDQTQHVLWRIEHNELESIHPRLVVLMIGTNNIDRQPVDIARGVTKIVTEIQTRLPTTKILLLAILPRGADPQDPTVALFRSRILETNQILAKLDNRSSLRFLDMGRKFLDANNRIPAELMPDALHPGPKGYQVWANAMQARFDEMMK
jgi:lysophospholipase L1-like esterase